MRAAPARPSRPGARVTAGLVAVLALALAGCAAETPEQPEPVTVTPSIEESRATPPEPVVPVVWPLTGVQTDELPERPAVAVKIENSGQARPQTGLDEADMVWETIIDFDVSRLVAVFHSQQPEGIGPIRSVRPMDMAIVAPLGGPLVYSGGQAGILALVPKAGIQGMNNDYGAAGMYRVSFRAAPHNVYGDVPTFVENADDDHSALPPEQFAFARVAAQATAVLDGDDATTVSLRLSTQSSPSWTWDGDSGTWLRSEGSTPATVMSGDRIGAVNVVAIVAPHPDSGFNAQLGAPVPTYELVGEGEGWVATGGKVVEVTWSKAATDEPIVLTTADGATVELAPGNTWIELVPEGTGSVTID